MVAPHPAPFYRLPEDILALIVDHGSRCTNYLPQLRLVHSRFAYLRHLQQLLFSCIRLTPDPLLMETHHLDRIKYFVKCVAFRPVCLRKYPTASDISEWELTAAEVASYIRGGKTRASFIDILLMLPNAKKFKVCSPGSHPNSIVSVPSGDALLELAITCLVATNIHPTGLELRHDRYWRRPWTSLSKWEEFNMTQLTEFHYRSTYVAVPTDRRYSSIPMYSVVNVLSNSARTLQRLYLESDELILWPLLPNAPLPQLRELTLSSCPLVAEHLGKWLLDCGSLQSFTLSKTRIGTVGQARYNWLSWTEEFRGPIQPWYGMQSWYQVFEAIRNHPNRMHVTLDSVLVWVGPAMKHFILSLAYATDEPSAFESGVGSNLRRSLKDYMSGRVQWSAVTDIRDLD